MTTTQLTPESRLDSFTKGMKQGVIKTAVDKVIDGITEPITSAILKNLAPDSPLTPVLEPAVKAIMSFIVAMGFAEAAAYFGPMAGKAIPSVGGDNLEEKTQLLAVWIRRYAGEKIGEQAINAAVEIFPLVLGHFSSITNEDLKIALHDDEPALENSPKGKDVPLEIDV